MPSFHTATFRLLGESRPTSPAAKTEIEETERRLGFRLPPSVREWYQCRDAVRILAEHSNDDPPIPLREFSVTQWKSKTLLPFRVENQGVCIWAIMLDGSDDPPVYVDVDSDGKEWHILAPTFSAYVYSCVWDYEMVFGQPALVQAQNAPITPETINCLAATFTEELRTHGWPGSTQYRFATDREAILIWSGEGQADWFVAAHDAGSLEAALNTVWSFDAVGESFYDCSEIGKAVLAKLRHEA